MGKGNNNNNRDETSKAAPLVGKLTKQQKRDLKRQSASIGKDKIPPVQRQPKLEGSSVYKRPCELPLDPLPTWPKIDDRFCTMADPCFNEIMERSYKGFAVEEPHKFDQSFHSTFQTAIEHLDDLNMYQFDYTQPAGLGTKVTRTFVSRCLVGDFGTTYKYLGIRMFSYPWSDTTESSYCESMSQIKQLNIELSKRSNKLLNSLNRPVVGSCDYNITLINRCFPEHSDIKLKDEPLFKANKCSVSWHADSCLEHFSSIAVYSFNTNNLRPCCGSKGAKKGQVAADKPWQAALRVSPHAEGPTSGRRSEDAEDQAHAPALCMTLDSGTCYYLLDDFNHHHQHCVLVGSTDRFASTHRVCREDGHTFQWIRTKCFNALQGTGQSLKQVRSEQLTLAEVEFEWIRQFYIQGQLHYDLHNWWQQPMQELLGIWSRLEARTLITLQALEDAATSGFDKVMATTVSKKEIKDLQKRKKRAESVEEKVYAAMVEALEDRETKRQGWQQREEDPMFSGKHTVPLNCRPVPVPFPSCEQGTATQLPSTRGSFTDIVENIKQWHEQFKNIHSTTNN